jgi:hypothetical protein
MDRRFGSRKIKDIQAAQAKLEQMQLEAQVAQFVRSNPGASFEDALRALKAQEYENDLLRRAASEQAVADRMDQQGQVRDLEQGLETSMGQNEILSAQLSDEQKKNIALIANAERTPNISQKRRAGELVAAILAGAGVLELVDPDPEPEK